MDSVRELTPEELADEALRREEAKALGIPHDPVPSRFEICARAGLIDRAAELGHPEPANATTEQIALLGNQIQILAIKLGHPRSGHATRAELAEMIGLPELATSPASVSRVDDGRGGSAWKASNPQLESAVLSALAKK